MGRDKEKQLKANRKSYDRHKLKRQAKNLEYAHRPENKIKKAAYDAIYRKTHPGKNFKWTHGNPTRFWASTSLSTHRSKGYAINLTLDELATVAANSPSCFYCGELLDFSPDKGRVRHNSPSLDRQENGKEISPENIKIICFRCNATKGPRTHTEFVTYCAMITKKYSI